MNLKIFFIGLLAVFGIVGLIYIVVLFIRTSGETRGVKELIVYGIHGIVLFMSTEYLFSIAVLQEIMLIKDFLV